MPHTVDTIERKVGRAVRIRTRDLSGSRLRCLMLTSLPAPDVVAFLNSLIHPHGVVSGDDRWLPKGFLHAKEARLGEAVSLVRDPKVREALTDWWLKVRGRANTPNWDFASTCSIGNEKGLVLIEAKAHLAELHDQGKTTGNPANDSQIMAAIQQANESYGAGDSEWGLTSNRCYQIANRFAWAWKLATCGVPTILIYLGFLNATEMGRCGPTFDTPEAWADAIRTHAEGLVPATAWGRALSVGSTTVTPLIRSATISAVRVEKRSRTETD
jgi:hypothetical protein